MATDISSAFIAEKLDTIAKYIAEIDQLDECHAKFGHQCEVLVSKFKTEIDVFQESPHQMDGRLPSLIDSLTNSVLKYMDDSPAKMNLSFSLAYLITKVRGYKVVIRHLPHAVPHMSPVIKMLSRQDPNDRSNWETKYMLLLWLSMLCLIPLNMNRFDGGDAGVPLAQRFASSLLPQPLVSFPSPCLAFMTSSKRICWSVVSIRMLHLSWLPSS